MTVKITVENKLTDDHRDLGVFEYAELTYQMLRTTDGAVIAEMGSDGFWALTGDGSLWTDVVIEGTE